MTESAHEGTQVASVERQMRDVRRLLASAADGGLGGRGAGDRAAGGGADAPTPSAAEARYAFGDSLEPGESTEVAPFRVVVATDFASESFSATTAPATMLRAFAQMFESGAPVNLVFAVGHEAGDGDVLGAQRLLGALTTTRALAGVAIESFEEAVRLPAYAAVVPTGDPYALVDDLTAAITAMHLLAETFANPGRLRIALVHQHLLSRRAQDKALADRLAAYREVDLTLG